MVSDAEAGCLARRRRPTRAAARAVVGALTAGVIGLQTHGLAAQQPPAGGSPQLPRYVSLKSDRVNLRKGPGTEYPIAWVFRRAGLPVEVTQEFEGWRQIRDAEGTTGWVLGTMLSGRRTAVILPWESGRQANAGREQQKASATLHYDESAQSQPIARVEAGVLASIISCDGRWCRVSIGGFRGYIEQAKLWGAYQGEVIN